MPLEIVNGTLLDQDATVILLPKNYYPTNQVNQELLDALTESREALKTAERIQIPFSKFLTNRYIAYSPPQGEPLYTEIAYVPFRTNQMLVETDHFRLRRPTATEERMYPKPIGIYRLICFWKALLPELWQRPIWKKGETKTLAIPIVGLGYDGISADLAGSIAVYAIREYLKKRADDIKITLVLSPRGFPNDLVDWDTFFDWEQFYNIAKGFDSIPPDLSIWTELAQKGLPNQSAFSIDYNLFHKKAYRVTGASPEDMEEFDMEEDMEWEEPVIGDSDQFEPQDSPDNFAFDSEKDAAFYEAFIGWLNRRYLRQRVVPMPSKQELSPHTDTEKISKELEEWQEQPGYENCVSKSDYMYLQSRRYLIAAIKNKQKDETEPLPKTAVFDTQKALALDALIEGSTISCFLKKKIQTLKTETAWKLALSMRLEPYHFQRFVWMATQSAFPVDEVDKQFLKQFIRENNYNREEVDAFLERNDRKERVSVRRVRPAHSKQNVSKQKNTKQQKPKKNAQKKKIKQEKDRSI